MGSFNSLDVQRSFYDRMQDLFGAPADNSSISHIISNFTASLESLAIAPNKTLELSEVLRQAQNTTIKLQAMSTTIQELRQQADNSVADIVTEINSLVTRIGDFNDTLVRNSTTNNDVTDLKDQRDQAIDRLAELIDIRYFVRSDGDAVVFTSNGRTLVDNIPATLTHRAASTVSATSTHAEGNIGGIFVGTEIAGNDITDEIKAGQLKGLIDLRDSVLTDLHIQIDGMAAQIRDTVNQIHNAGAPYPGMQSMTGSRSFVSPTTQTMTLDPTNSTDDVTIALFDSNGDQTAATTLNTIMTSAIYGTGAETSRGNWTITEVAATLQDWLRANGASSATAAVNSAGKFAIELNTPSLNLAFRDETATADGSTRGDAVIGFNSGGLPQVTIVGTVEAGDTYSVTINGTKVTYTVTGGEANLAAVRDALFAAINANGTINTVVTAAAGTNAGDITITADTAGATFTITASATNNGVTADNSAVVNPGGGNDETVNGFSYFLGLNDFFVDGLPENIHDTDVLASAFVSTAATLTFNDSTGVLKGSPLTIAAGSSLTAIATLITSNVTNVTAKVVPDGSGVRLRISHDKGTDLVVTQASGDTLLTDIGLHVSDVRAASVLAVRSDIITTPSLMSRGAMQFNTDLGDAGEYFQSVGDDTVIKDLAEKFNSTVAFKQAGGLSDITTTFGEFASSILSRNATLLRPAPGAATPGTPPSRTAPPGAVPGAPQIPGTAAPSSQHPPAARAASAPRTVKTALPAGTRFAVKVLAVTPSAAPTARAPGGTAIEAGRILTGTVAGKTAAGQPIVHTRAGVMALAARATVAEGARVTMEVTAPPVLPKMTDGMPVRDGLLLTRGWPGLNDAVQALAEASPAAAQQLVNTIVPQPGPQLAATLLFFLMALQGGDMRAWLGGDTARLLQSARPDILTRLGDDFSQLSRMAEEPVSGDWRVALIPFYSEQELQQLRLYSRRHGSDDEGDGPSGTRFVIDVDLSRLGRLQIDGLVRNGGKHLDLIVRTEAPLPDEMAGDIRQIFGDAKELTGFTGGIAFQAAPPDFVEVAPEKIVGDHLIA